MSNIITNFEFHKDKLVELGSELAIKNGVVCKCNDVDCDGCIGCDATDVIEWLLQPYQDPTHVLTKKEHQFCELVEKGYIARDFDGLLYLYEDKPHKDDYCWDSSRHMVDLCEFNDLVKLKFDFIKWTDEEPWSIEELLKLKVVD